MNNVWNICKINLAETFGGGGTKRKKSLRSRGGAGTAIVFILLAAYILFNFYNVGRMMAEQYGAAGEERLMLYMAYFLSFIFVVSMSVFQMPAYLFGAKDYDFLMSMPIKSSQVVAGKLMPLYITNFAYSFVFTAGIFFAYGQYTRAGAAFYVLAVLGMLLAPLAPMAVSALLTWILERVAAVFRAKNIVRLITTFLMMIVLMGSVFFLTGTGIFDVESVKNTFTGVAGVIVTGEFFMRGLSGSALNMVWYALISVAVFAVFVGVFAKSYRGISSARSTERRGEGYSAKDIKTSSVLMSLYKKDISFFFANTNYALNSGMGLVLLTIAAIAAAVAGGDVFAGMGIPACAVVAAVLAFTLMMSQVCAPAVSLEAPYLWLLKSSPVRTMDILRAKLLSAMVITFPLAAVDALFASIALGASAADTAVTVLYAFALCAFVASFGLTVGLKHPKLDWTNDIVVIKQSSAIMITVLLGMLIAFVMIGAIMALSITLGAYLWITLALSAVLILISAFMYSWIRKKGVSRFERLYR